MKEPIFVDYNGDLVAFTTVASAELYIEPEDARDPRNTIYDSEGTILTAQNVPDTDSWLARSLGLALPSRRMRLEGGSKSDPDGLARKIRHALDHFNLTRDERDNSPLSRLVELSLPLIQE